MTLWDFLLLPFQFEFMNNALIIAGLVAVPMALLSCFLVLKGWSLMGDAISAAALRRAASRPCLGAKTKARRKTAV